MAAGMSESGRGSGLGPRGGDRGVWVCTSAWMASQSSGALADEPASYGCRTSGEGFAL